jgi:3-deoxy-D-manno-octulosonic-acid transferase
MKDFQDGVELVLSAGAGFQVQDAADLADLLSDHINNSPSYRRACSAAAELADLQQGAVQCQADMVMQQLSI